VSEHNSSYRTYTLAVDCTENLSVLDWVLAPLSPARKTPMLRHLVLIVLLVFVASGIGSSSALAAPWYEGEWKHDMENTSLAVRFGSNGAGVLHMYKNGNQVGGGPMKWRKSGQDIIVTRNGVDIKFQLDERRKVVRTADGSAMKRIEQAKPTAGGGCEEACWANNASNNDLKKRYGTSAVPSRLAWGQRFTDGAGQRAYQSCSQPHGLKAITDPVIAARCNKAAFDGCVKACVDSGRSR
jgi:hypothetical protein